ncbi:MAG: hypothetical protein ACR2F1_11085 [Nitrososphaeraceae archaeon]
MKNSIMLLNAIKEKPFIAIGLAIAIFFITPIVQSFSTPLAFEIWFRDLYQKPLNSILYIVFSILFGIFISMYLYSRNKCIKCDLKKTYHSTSGFIGSFLGFMLGICPACFSFVGFLLPLSTSIFLTTYTPFFTLLSIAIIIFSINKLGGFKKVNSNIFMKND